MNAESLKNSILQLAIQGKLVEQREEDGTAEELYKEIQLEKEKLIEEGKIRKQKKLPKITEEEIPFEIPDNWRWVRLNDLVKSIRAGGDKPKEFSKEITSDRKSTRLNSSHVAISYAVFCLKKKN